jgi:hypothetical protein
MYAFSLVRSGRKGSCLGAQLPELVGLPRRSLGHHNILVSIGDEARCSLRGLLWPLRGSRGRTAVLIYCLLSGLIAG